MNKSFFGWENLIKRGNILFSVGMIGIVFILVLPLPTWMIDMLLSLSIAIAVLNVGSDRISTHPFHLNLTKLGLHGPLTGKNLWTGGKVTLTNNQPIELASHDILLIRVAAPR